jgi:hypothetical protein
LTDRERELAGQLRRVTLHLKAVEQGYHMYPSFDRPVEGCNNCAAVAAAEACLEKEEF